MDSDNSISVLMPVRDGAAFIGAAIESALTQTLPPAEVVVVDDGSTDNTRRMVQQMGGPIRLIEQKALGLEPTRNRCIREAKHPVLAFLDSDDLWPLDRLERLNAARKRNPSALVQGRLQRFEDRPEGRKFVAEARLAPSLCTALIPAKLFTGSRIGPLDEDLAFSGDVDWWLRFRRARLPLIEVEEIVLYYRRHAGNMTSDQTADQRGLLEALRRTVQRRRAEAKPSGTSTPPQGP